MTPKLRRESRQWTRLAERCLDGVQVQDGDLSGVGRRQPTDVSVASNLELAHLVRERSSDSHTANGSGLAITSAEDEDSITAAPARYSPRTRAAVRPASPQAQTEVATYRVHAYTTST